MYYNRKDGLYMPYENKISFIHNEISVLTGLNTEIICDGPKSIQFITDKRKSRIIDVTDINSTQELIMYSRLASLDLTRPA